MVFTKEEAEVIKKQLLSQVEKLPSENKVKLIEYIKDLNGEELEEFLKQNKIDYKSTSSGPSSKKNQECVFCSIIKKEMPSYTLEENKKAIAVLELNPLSKGHTIILPVKHSSIEEIPKSVLTFAQKIGKRLKKKLKSDDIKIETSSFQGHAMINVIPLYNNIPIGKKKAEDKELQILKNKLERKNRAKRDKKPKTIEKQESNLPKVSFRVP